MNKTPSFKAETSLANEAKTLINSCFAKLSRKDLPKIILDSSNLNTTKALRAKGHIDWSIHIPNSNLTDYNLIRKKHKNTYFQTVGDFLKDFKGKLGGVYLDYMCTFDGDLYCNPRNDLELIFKRKQLINAPLAVTFSNSRKEKEYDCFKWQDIGKVFNYINLLANSNDVFIELVPIGGPYRNLGNMFSYIFMVRK